MVVSGLPIRNGDEHAREVARMSLAVVQGMEHFQSVHVPQQRLKVRIGIHSGQTKSSRTFISMMFKVYWRPDQEILQGVRCRM